MSLRDYLDVLRHNWFVVLVLGALFAGGAYAYAASLPPVYQASASLYVSVPGGSSVGELVQLSNYARSRIDSYAELATKPYVLDPVIERLGLTQSATSLRGSVSVTRTLNTEILDVRAKSSDPERAADLANAVSEELALAVDRLEGVEGVEGVAASVRLTVIAEAQVPRFPIEPSKRLYAMTGLMVGLALAVAIALLRAVLETRVRSVRDVRRVTDAAVLSSIRYDRRGARDQLTMRTEPLGDRAEAYRRLRTNLRFLNLPGPCRRILVTSSVPTEGKTTTSLNLAIAMAEGNQRILLIDADLRKPAVAKYLGLEGAAGLTTVLIGEAAAEDVIQPWGDCLDVLAAGQLPPNPSEILDSEAMGELLDELAEDYDVILIDSPPLVPVTDAAVLSRFVDGTLVVVGCQTVRRSQLEEALGALQAVGARVLGLVLNQISTKEIGTTYVYGHRAGRRRWGRRRRRATAHRVVAPARLDPKAEPSVPVERRAERADETAARTGTSPAAPEATVATEAAREAAVEQAPEVVGERADPPVGLGPEPAAERTDLMTVEHAEDTQHVGERA